MVTASRDSTVKVWEADWQIRMVFVGHTGAPCRLLRLVVSPRPFALKKSGLSRIPVGSGCTSLHWPQSGLTAPLPLVSGAPK